MHPFQGDSKRMEMIKILKVPVFLHLLLPPLKPQRLLFNLRIFLQMVEGNEEIRAQPNYGGLGRICRPPCTVEDQFSTGRTEMHLEGLTVWI
jgi:hypothetical protein